MGAAAPFEISLRAALFAALVALPTIGALIASWSAGERSHALVRERSVTGVRAAADGLRLQLDGVTQPTAARAAVVENLLEIELLSLLEDGEFQRYAFEEMKSLPWISALYVGRPDRSFAAAYRRGFDAEGKEIWETREIVRDGGAARETITTRDERYRPLGETVTRESVYDPTLRPWYRAASAEPGVRWTPEYVFYSSNTLGVTAATALRNGEGEVIAVVGADISLATIHELVRTFSERHDLGIALIGVSGRVIATSEPGSPEAGDAAETIARFAYRRADRRIEPLPSGEDVFDYVTELDDERRAIAAISAPGERVRWRALAWTVERTGLLALVAAYLGPLGLVMVGIGVAASAFGFWIWRGVIEPIGRVVAAADAIGANGPAAFDGLGRRRNGFRELDKLCDAFEGMAGALAKREAESDALAAELRAESRSRAFAARSLERSRDRLERILQSAPCGIVEWAPDEEGVMRVRLWSRRAARMFGRTNEVAQGADLIEIGAIAQAAQSEARALARSFARGEAVEAESRWPHVGRQGEMRMVRWRHASLRAGRDHSIAVLSVIDEAPAESSGVADLARDAVTGQGSRIGLESKIASLLAVGEPLSIWMVGVGAMARFNDMYGVEAGNGFLRAVGLRLADVFEDVGCVYRFRGDSFVAIRRGPSSVEDVDRMGEKALEALARPVRALGSSPSAMAHPGARIGAARAPEDAATCEELLAAAEAALSETTSSAPASLFDEAARRALERKKRLSADLSAALAADELDLAYQPQWRLADMRMTGVEALIRWPARGAPPPAEFVPLAESAGLISDLGDWALRRACAQLAQWRREGVDIETAVNVSAVQFVDPELARSFEAVIEQTGADPRKLELEITETAIADWRDPSVRATLERIDALGIRLALDDFGAGATSLAHFEDLPIATLKLDKRFVAAIGLEGRGEALLRGLIKLAHELGVEVIAEGVETPTQLDFLRSIDCDKAQGFLLARPMAIEQVAAAYRGDTGATAASAD